MNLQYGCGFSVGNGWYNCDGSATVRLQRLPVMGMLFRRILQPQFPAAVHYGDIVRGLKIVPNSCDAIYCSHVLEHLSLHDCRRALRNTYTYLKDGGIFRLVVPDFEQQVHAYLGNSAPSALINFMGYTHLGRETRPKGFLAWVREVIGNSHHLWMWDFKSMAQELEVIGFKEIRRCNFNDSKNIAFQDVEVADRFEWGLAIEAKK